MTINEEMNERLVRIGPGTPMGEVFRRYWIPALLSEEIPMPDTPPVRVRLLCEDLIAFRDSDGNVGLVEAYCAHRRAPLFFGRNEACGLRCVYHGWKYDVSGNCVDIPSEPSYSKLRLNVAITAYPTYEKGGVIFAYMGPSAEMPPPPDYEWMRAPSTHRGVSKTSERCNFLQAVEGGVDTVHSTFLHNNNVADFTSRQHIPELQVELTEYGLRYGAIRNISDEESYVRVNVFIMPNQQMRATLFENSGHRINAKQRAGVPAKYPTLDGHIWVPMDDESTNVYSWKYAALDGPWLTAEEFALGERRTGRSREDHIPGTFWMKRSLANDFFIDRDLQRKKTFTGISGTHAQDFAIQEGMGPIMRRDLESLGSSDKAVRATRQLMMTAMEDVAAGRSPCGSDPSTHRFVRAGEMVMPRGLSWQESTKQAMQTFWN